MSRSATAYNSESSSTSISGISLTTRGASFTGRIVRRNTSSTSVPFGSDAVTVISAPSARLKSGSVSKKSQFSSFIAIFSSSGSPVKAKLSSSSSGSKKTRSRSAIFTIPASSFLTISFISRKTTKSSGNGLIIRLNISKAMAPLGSRALIVISTPSGMLKSSFGLKFRIFSSSTFMLISRGEFKII